jgi:hypothetical protein
VVVLAHSSRSVSLVASPQTSKMNSLNTVCQWLWLICQTIDAVAIVSLSSLCLLLPDENYSRSFSGSSDIHRRSSTRCATPSPPRDAPQTPLHAGRPPDGLRAPGQNLLEEERRALRGVEGSLYTHGSANGFKILSRSSNTEIFTQFHVHSLKVYKE